MPKADRLSPGAVAMLKEPHVANFVTLSGDFDVRKQAVLSVTDELRRLADPCRDQRDAGSQRLEHGLRPSLLPRGDE